MNVFAPPSRHCPASSMTPYSLLVVIRRTYAIEPPSLDRIIATDGGVSLTPISTTDPPAQRIARETFKWNLRKYRTEAVAHRGGVCRLKLHVSLPPTHSDVIRVLPSARWIPSPWDFKQSLTGLPCAEFYVKYTLKTFTRCTEAPAIAELAFISGMYASISRFGRSLHTQLPVTVDDCYPASQGRLLWHTTSHHVRSR